MTTTDQPATSLDIESAIRGLGDGPLTEDGLRTHVFPLFSRVLSREEIYLANHSLGRPLDRMAEDVRAAIDAWYADMDGAWGLWVDERERYRSLMARLIGLNDPKAIVPKTSAGQALRAVLNALPRKNGPIRVVATRGEFDSIDCILKVYRAKGLIEVRWVDGDDAGAFHAGDIVAATDSETDLVLCSQVVFATGQAIESIHAVVARAREVGAYSLIDTYHAVGAIPFDFARLDADFAIGGNYKYTRGGPGAAWLAVQPRLLPGAREPRPGDLAPIDTGWFARPEPMGFDRTDDATLAGGGDGWLESTPPILTYFQAKAGLEFTLAIGVDRLRAYNLELQSYLIDRLRGRNVDPIVHEHRGAFFLVPSADERTLCASLKDRGLNTDARRCPTTGRGFVRICPDILNTREELDRAVDIICEVMG
ncbi:MAG: aminotransferase [Phycisphaerae bacterium]|nr:aminotransferase [Phycisphaerae bacterium]